VREGQGLMATVQARSYYSEVRDRDRGPVLWLSRLHPRAQIAKSLMEMFWIACPLTNFPAAAVTTTGLEEAKLFGRFCKMSGKGLPNAIDE